MKLNHFIIICFGLSSAQRTKFQREVADPINCGDEFRVKSGDRVTINYTGYLANGTIFETTTNKDPLTFKLGEGKVIEGWEMGILGTCAGEDLTMVVPPELGYGQNSAGEGAIPPGSTLYFTATVEVVSRIVAKAPEKDENDEYIFRGGKCRDIKTARLGDFVVMETQATLFNGAKVDSSVDRVKLGEGQLLPGWELGLLGACQGEKRRIMVGPKLAYGSRGVDRLVPPQATIVLDIGVLKVQRDLVGNFLNFLANKPLKNI